jgi:bifunctional DNA-binding transcriptional regulator/antitoxin component of YhaV-PrlF toxin-antitoxin module
MNEIRMSTRGRVVVPKAIRDKQCWRKGMTLTVEDLPEGVLLRLVTKKASKPSTTAQRRRTQ